MRTAEVKKTEQLKDRRDYRSALIQRREDVDRKIAAVEKDIRKLVKNS